MEKKRLIIITALSLMVLFNGTALGAYSNYRCVIEQIGIKDNGVVRVQLTELNGSFDRQWFHCDEKISKEMLAILLTASANNMVVKIRADLQQGPEPIIAQVYMFP